MYTLLTDVCDCAVLQVNSDLVYYSRSKDGTLEPVRVNTSYVGRMVLTKAVLDKGRRDIIDHYKFPEGRAAKKIVHKSQQILKNKFKISL